MAFALWARGARRGAGMAATHRGGTSASRRGPLSSGAVCVYGVSMGRGGGQPLLRRVLAGERGGVLWLHPPVWGGGQQPLFPQGSPPPGGDRRKENQTDRRFRLCFQHVMGLKSTFNKGYLTSIQSVRSRCVRPGGIPWTPNPGSFRARLRAPHGRCGWRAIGADAVPAAPPAAQPPPAGRKGRSGG